MPPLSVHQLAATPRELELFQLFATETVRQVASTFDYSFWAIDVLQAAVVYPAVWHATIAMSAMHQRLKHGVAYSSPDAHRAAQEHYVYALKSYNASIAELKKITGNAHVGPGEQEATLMSSLLFTGLCSMQGDLTEAMIHARNGLEMFDQWKFWKNKDRVLSVASVAAQIAYFEGQFINKRSQPKGRAKIRAKRSTLGASPSDTPFATAKEAYWELQPLLISLLEMEHGQDTHVGSPHLDPQPQPLDKRHTFRKLFAHWHAKFLPLELALNGRGADKKSMLLMRMLYTACHICLYVDFDRMLVSWDDHDSEFSQVVDLAHDLFREYAKEDAVTRAMHKEGNSVPIFSFAPSICETLYFVGGSCRNGVTRRRVISLLRKWPRRDGLWDAQLIASICEAIMKFEEAAAKSESGCECRAGKFICNGHRVVGSDVSFVDDWTLRLTLTTVGDVILQQPGATLELAVNLKVDVRVPNTPATRKQPMMQRSGYSSPRFFLPSR